MEMNLEEAFNVATKALKWDHRNTTQRTYILRDLFHKTRKDLTAKTLTNHVVEMIKAGKPKSTIYSFNYLIGLCFEHGFKKPLPARNLGIDYLCKKYKIRYQPAQSPIPKPKTGIAFMEIDIKDAMELIAAPGGRYTAVVSEVLVWAKNRKEGKAFVLKPPSPDKTVKKPYTGLMQALLKSLRKAGHDGLKISWNARENVITVYSKQEAKAQ